MIDAVMTVRNRPFKEWNVVYYDGEKTNPETLLTQLRKNGCAKAQVVKPKKKTVAGVEAILANPISAPGDLILLDVPLAKQKKIKVDVRAPDGWKVVSNEAGRIGLQSSAKTKPGNYELNLRVRRGQKAVDLALSGELVKLVPSR